MKIILLKDIKGVGRKFEVKNVGDGYAINKLIPQKFAEAATPSALNKLEKLKSEIATLRKVDEDLARANIKQLAEQGIVLSEKANDEGNLFAGIHTKEISNFIKQQTKLDIDPSWIVLDKPIKKVGEYLIPVEWENVKGQFSLKIEAGK